MTFLQPDIIQKTFEKRAPTDDSDDDCYTIDFKEGTIVDAR